MSTNRRQFIQQLAMAATGPLGLLNATAFANASDNSSSPTQRRLVLVELAGANDGLNTLVPYRDDNYYRLRPSLALPQQSLLSLSDDHGLHGQLRPLMPIWESGSLAWVHGLGYPQPNRSHFASIALWESGGDGQSQRANRGWLTHAIEHRLPRAINDPHGISFAGDLNVFASDAGRWLSLKSIENIESEVLPSQINKSISSHPSLALVQRRLRTLDTTLASLADKVAGANEVHGFNGGAFGEQLRQVAQMISAGVDTPVYRVQIAGFDTHQYQQGQHGQLLGELATGLSDFSGALKALGEWNNTLVMTYSEFGRRAAQNNSAGTDHGTAAPHLVMGGAISGGLYGNTPSLSNLIDDDMQHTMDYRALYRSMLTKGLGIDENYRYLAEYKDPRLAQLMSLS